MESLSNRMPMPLGTEYTSPNGDVTLLWSDFDVLEPLLDKLVICLDGNDDRILIMSRDSLETNYTQQPNNNNQLELDLGE